MFESWKARKDSTVIETMLTITAIDRPLELLFRSNLAEINWKTARSAAQIPTGIASQDSAADEKNATTDKPINVAASIT
jgi:hypothetical protein